LSPPSDRKREAQLRHWSSYRSVGEWYDEYHGHVPIQMAVGLSRPMRRHPDLTFPEAYIHLIPARTIIELDPNGFDDPVSTRVLDPKMAATKSETAGPGVRQHRDGTLVPS
jgi:hypothetical protein